MRGADAEQNAINSFQESPGQAFLRERGERALLRNASATGGLHGGNVLRELQEQGIGFANTFLGERKDRLAGLAGMGLGAVANQAGINQNQSANMANMMMGRGNAHAQGTLGRASGIRRGLSQVAGAFTGTGGFGGFGGSGPAPASTGAIVPGSLQTPQQFYSDRRLKSNIKRIGTVNGHNWYTFDYVWGEASQGVMSDEVPAEYVTQVGGFDMVDYSRIL